MSAPAAPNTSTTTTFTTPNTSDYHAASDNAAGNGYPAPSGYPAGAAYRAPNGYQGYGYPVAPMSAPVAPVAAPRSRTGLPWFIAGVTLWAIAVTHLMLLPQWLETKTTDGVVGNLTGVLAEIGIGAALLAVGFARRRQDR